MNLSQELLRRQRAGPNLKRSDFLRAGVRPAAPVIQRLIDVHHQRFGVAPICRALATQGDTSGHRTIALDRTTTASWRMMGRCDSSWCWPT